MGNQLSQLTATDTSTPTIQLPKAGPPGPKGDQGPPGPPGNPSLLLGTDDFKKAVNKSIDPDVIKPKSLDLKYSGIQDTESILKMYGVNTGTTNYYLMKGGHGETDNITIDALGNIMTKGNVDVGGTVRANGARLLGNVDQDPTGNFWLGLNGTASEPDRLAIAMIGDKKTGKVNNVTISKDAYIGANPLKFSSGWSAFPDGRKNGAEISNDTDVYKQLMIVGNTSAGGPRKVGIWDRLDVNGTLNVNGDATVNGKLLAASVQVNGNTTLGPTVLQNSSTFKVGGKSDTFYPVIFYDNGWNNGQYRLEITRANVHTDSGWRGSMRFICEGHTTNWGHGVDSMDFYYISANDNGNKTNPEAFDMFVSNAVNWWAGSYIIVWLRGNSSYEWRSLTGMTLYDGNKEGVDKQSVNIGTAEKPRMDTWAQRKDIEGRFNLAAKYYDVGNLRNRPATRHFDSDLSIPSGRHLWIRDQYHGMTFGPDDNFPNAPDGPVVFGYGGGALGTTAGGNKKVAMTWDVNNDVVAKNSLVVSKDLVVNGGLYPIESIKSQAGHNLYVQASDKSATSVLSGKGAYAQILTIKDDGSEGSNVLVGPNYVSSKADTFTVSDSNKKIRLQTNGWGEQIGINNNQWLFHTPGDGRTSMYITPIDDNGAPMWGVNTNLDRTGKLTVNGTLCIGSTCIGEAQLKKIA